MPGHQRPALFARPVQRFPGQIARRLHIVQLHAPLRHVRFDGHGQRVLRLDVVPAHAQQPHARRNQLNALHVRTFGGNGADEIPKALKARLQRGRQRADLPFQLRNQLCALPVRLDCGSRSRLSVTRLAQPCGEVAVAPHPLRPYAYAALLRCARARQLKILIVEIGMALQERGDGFLVFVAVEGAGGVHQPAAGTKHLCRPIQYLCLPPGAARRGRRIPLTPRVRFAAEHALAGAGGVAEYGVKGLGPFLCQRVRIGVHHGGIAHAHALQIGGEHLCPGGLRLIGDQQSLTAQRRGDLRTLAAGRGAQIQYALAGYGP